MIPTVTLSTSLPQNGITDFPLDATETDLAAILAWFNPAISRAMTKRQGSVRELLAEGYGELTITLRLEKGRIKVARVNVGTVDQY